MIQALQLPVLLLGSHLTVASETPDALCPSLEQARSAISARVGSVEGGPFVAKYAVVRDAREAKKFIHLRLLGPAEELLLERRIPLSPGDCGVAAKTLALMLERYFDGVGNGAESDPSSVQKETGEKETELEEPSPVPSEPEPVSPSSTSGPSPSSPAKKESDPQPQRHDSPASEEQEAEPDSYYRLGLGADSDGLPSMALGWGHELGSKIFLGIDAALPFGVDESREQEASISVYTGAVYLGAWYRVPVCAVAGSWRCAFGAGPVLGGFVQRVAASGVAVESGREAFRLAVGAGLQAHFHAAWSERWGVELGGRASGMVLGRPLVIREVDDSESEVAALPQLRGELMLSVRYEL